MELQAGLLNRLFLGTAHVVFRQDFKYTLTIRVGFNIVSNTRNSEKFIPLYSFPSLCMPILPFSARILFYDAMFSLASVILAQANFLLEYHSTG